MDRIRVSISGLMVVVAVSAVVFATLRANSGVGVNLVFCISLALNFATAAVLPVGMPPRPRFAALGYAVGGWGWMVTIASVHRIDAFLRDSVVIPQYIERVAPGLTPGSLVLNPTVNRILLLCHSLCAIASGMTGAAVAWKLRGRRDDEAITTQTTGLP